jgi:hypothetical protein
MELTINELDSNDVSYIQSSFEQIPENSVPIKVVKNVHFQESKKPLHQSIPRANAKISRPFVVPQKPNISYDEILSKMGMFVSQGKLHLLDENQKHIQKQIQPKQSQTQTQNIQQPVQPKYDIDPNIPQNSYIYNKYFRDQIPEPDNIRKPLTLIDYRNMLIQDALQKTRIKQVKSTKLIMPHSNINLAAGSSSNLNKLFDFSKR